MLQATNQKEKAKPPKQLRPVAASGAGWQRRPARPGALRVMPAGRRGRAGGYRPRSAGNLSEGTCHSPGQFLGHAQVGWQFWGDVP